MDIEELKKLALAATPGEWVINHEKDIDCDYGRQSGGIVARDGSVVIIADPSEGEYRDGIDLNSPDAAFIAAANPQTILALIRELEDMKHDLERSIATSADFATELEEARRLLCEARENLYSMTDPALISRIDAAILKMAES